MIIKRAQWFLIKRPMVSVLDVSSSENRPARRGERPTSTCEVEPVRRVWKEGSLNECQTSSCSAMLDFLAFWSLPCAHPPDNYSSAQEHGYMGRGTGALGPWLRSTVASDAGVELEVIRPYVFPGGASENGLILRSIVDGLVL